MKKGSGRDSVSCDRWFQALSWHEALREAGEEELTGSVGRKWQGWYSLPENRRLFDNMSRLLADRHLYRERNRSKSHELQDDLYDLTVPIATWRKGQPLRVSRKSPGRRWRLPAVIGVTTVAVLVLLWLRPSRLASRSTVIVYQTQVGGLKDVNFPDGSSVVLGGSTKLTATFSGHRRSASVLAGQAWFKVVHNAISPFVVTAGDGTITDLGTAFLVTRDSDRVVVTVTEGTVEVSARQAMRPSITRNRGLVLWPSLAPIQVSRGEQLAFSDAGKLSALRAVDTRVTTAWTHGRLTFDNQPLRYVVEAVNRYSSRHIVISPSAGTFRFSGIIFDDEIEDWLQSLAVIFPVSVETRGGAVSIQMRDSAPAVN